MAMHWQPVQCAPKLCLQYITCSLVLRSEFATFSRFSKHHLYQKQSPLLPFFRALAFFFFRILWVFLQNFVQHFCVFLLHSDCTPRGWYSTLCSACTHLSAHTLTISNPASCNQFHLHPYFALSFLSVSFTSFESPFPGSLHRCMFSNYLLSLMPIANWLIRPTTKPQ